LQSGEADGGVVRQMSLGISLNSFIKN